ncbi:unnamed protein product [Caenorhabditis auriculariae]|uniref:Ribosome maturation protein SBDS n=1 Tax=Caenorhabditis auriculariae TaxID=2777116 RepID=A0A8S1GYX8_9PELO|nr:unnamed protein product [Caenorhabditis auriculariae]
MPEAQPDTGSDEIDIISSSDEAEPIFVPRERDPIVIRGVGTITMFGLNSRFNTEYPPELAGYIAPEEISATLNRINRVLKRHVQTSSKWLLCGLMFCCCSLGCSMWPVVCLNQRTVAAVEKTLDHENVTLYHKLHLHWSLMSKNIKTPTNQKVLTNVAVVRMKKMGKRFEIACYKNKVVNWRNKTHKDIDEVLQSNTVFANVSKGQLAKREDLAAAFGSEDQLEICKLILEKGDLQVSDKERQAASDQSLKEVSQLIASMVVNPETKRPIPPSVIDKALHEVHFSLKPNRSAKQQALEAIPKLRETMKIERAKMRIRVAMGNKEAKGAHVKLKQLFSEVEVDDWAESGLELIGLIEPGNFRLLDDLVRNESKGAGRLEILSLKDIVEGEVQIS